MDGPSDLQTGTWRDRLQRFRAHVTRFLPFTLGVFAAFLAVLLYNLLFPGPIPLTLRDVNDTVAIAMASATPRPAFSSQVYQVVQPSLVLIQTHGSGEDRDEGDGLGSGVVITENGDILTSLHVVEGASEIKVTFADGTETSAQVIMEQPENDIAVVQTELLPQFVVPAVLGNPNALRVGDEVYAVGNPFGLYSSMSAGVVSGFNRTFQPADSDQQLQGLIQIDAAVNPGNSGGPLLNRSGHVVGIVTGIVNPTNQRFFVGIGFAVPINVAAGGLGSPPY